jgi:hypothetical protein
VPVTQRVGAVSVRALMLQSDTKCMVDFTLVFQPGQNLSLSVSRSSHLSQMHVLAFAAVLLSVSVVRATAPDVCKLTTSVNGKKLEYDINVLLRK